MFLSKLFNREAAPAAADRVESGEHLAPTAYFTSARIDDLRDTLGKLGSLTINSITPIDQ